MEWIVVNSSEDQVVNARLTAERIDGLLNKLVHKNYKYYERKIKQYVKDDMFYEVVLDHKDVISDIRCYTKHIEEHVVEGKFLKLKCLKHKKPIHAFSSSLDINDVRYIKRLTFRVSNRIFINFDAIEDVDGDSYNMAFVNANCDANVDKDYVLTEVVNVLSLLS